MTAIAPTIDRSSEQASEQATGQASGEEAPGGVAGWAVEVMSDLGAAGAGLLVALENLFPPVPSEVILPLAGFAASRGEFHVVEALVWTTLGSTVGAVVLYALGALVGRDRVVAVWERMPLTRTSDVLRTEAWFERHGRKAVFLGRMVPLFRSLVSLPAGTTRMPLWQFTALTLAGSAIWNSVFVLAGYQLGENWSRIEHVVGWVQWVVVAVVAVAVGRWTLRRVRSRRQEQGQAPT